MAKNDYETLSPDDLLLIARDTLRGRESDHFRLSLLDPSSSGGSERLKVLETEIAAIKGQINTLEARTEK